KARGHERGEKREREDEVAALEGNAAPGAGEEERHRRDEENGTGEESRRRPRADERDEPDGRDPDDQADRERPARSEISGHANEVREHVYRRAELRAAVPGDSDAEPRSEHSVDEPE